MTSYKVVRGALQMHKWPEEAYQKLTKENLQKDIAKPERIFQCLDCGHTVEEVVEGLLACTPSFSKYLRPLLEYIRVSAYNGDEAAEQAVETVLNEIVTHATWRG